MRNQENRGLVQKGLQDHADTKPKSTIESQSRGNNRTRFRDGKGQLFDILRVAEKDGDEKMEMSGMWVAVGKKVQNILLNWRKKQMIGVGHLEGSIYQYEDGLKN